MAVAASVAPLAVGRAGAQTSVYDDAGYAVGALGPVTTDAATDVRTDAAMDGSLALAPAPGQPTLEALIRLASSCALGKYGSTLVTVTLVFARTGRLRSRTITSVSQRAPSIEQCVLDTFRNASVSPFTGPDRSVGATVVVLKW